MNDVVTVATPHLGALNTVHEDLCDKSNIYRECDGMDRSQMKVEGSLLHDLNAYALKPRGATGINWTNISSTDDDVVGERSAEGMTPHHKWRYRKEKILHSDYFATVKNCACYTKHWPGKTDTWDYLYDDHQPLRRIDYSVVRKYS